MQHHGVAQTEVHEDDMEEEVLLGETVDIIVGAMDIITVHLNQTMMLFIDKNGRAMNV